MKKYLVLTMSKSTNEIRKSYVDDVAPHGTCVEEYIDSVISEVGDVLWSVFRPGVPEEVAERAFLELIESRSIVRK